MLHWKFCVQASTIGGIDTEVIPYIAWAWKNEKSDSAFAATCAAVFEKPRPDAIAEAVNAKPAMTANVHPTAF